MRRVESWIGIGKDESPQPDMFETVYRLGWWRVAVCRFCLITALKNASALIEQLEALLTQPKKQVRK